MIVTCCHTLTNQTHYITLSIPVLSQQLKRDGVDFVSRLVSRYFNDNVRNYQSAEGRDGIPIIPELQILLPDESTLRPGNEDPSRLRILWQNVAGLPIEPDLELRIASVCAVLSDFDIVRHCSAPRP